MDERKFSNEKWRLEARWVEAQVFVSRGGKGEGESESEGGMMGWELGRAIEGVYEVDGGGEMEVVDSTAWGAVEEEDGGSGEESEWEMGDLTLDGEWAGEVVWGGSWNGREVDLRKIEW